MVKGVSVKSSISGMVETRVRFRMHTTLENGILRNGQQPGRTVHSFFDHGKFEAMKTVSSWEATYCDEDQFHAKIKVSAGELLLFETHEERSEQRIRKLTLLLLHTFAFSCLLHGFWALI